MVPLGVNQRPPFDNAPDCGASSGGSIVPFPFIPFDRRPLSRAELSPRGVALGQRRAAMAHRSVIAALAPLKPEPGKLKAWGWKRKKSPLRLIRPPRKNPCAGRFG